MAVNAETFHLPDFPRKIFYNMDCSCEMWKVLFSTKAEGLGLTSEAINKVYSR